MSKAEEAVNRSLPRAEAALQRTFPEIGKHTTIHQLTLEEHKNTYRA
jgi:hypothetical protein